MTTSSTLSADSPDLLAALADLDGVDGVTPEAADALRVRLNGDQDQRAVSTSIATVLRERFGVSGARTSTVEEIGAIEGEGRLALERLVLVAGNGGATADVVVRLDDRTAPGSASSSGAGPAASTEAEAAGAAITTALLLALEELTEDAVIGGIERVGIDSDGVARVRLRLDVDGADVPASGEAAVIRHRPQAVVRAVLAAVEPHLP